MKNVGVLGLALAAAMLVVAAPAVAQEGREGGAFSYPMGGPISDGYPPPDYAYRNGEVYVDGDEALDCRTFAKSFDEGYDEWGNQAQAGRVLERCRRAGLPSGNPPPGVRAEIRADALAETGGLPLLPLAAGALLLASAGGVALRRTR